MKILIVTPAPPKSRKGNRITALRWSRILRDLGHDVTIRQQFDGESCDVMVALHARRSAADIQRFRRSRPKSTLVLALTGTDLYRDIHHNETARHSLERADRLVLLQPHGQRELPDELAAKTRVIYQSVATPKNTPRPLKNVFEICVIGHLRPVKDPFRTALAVRRLPASSKIRIVHLGAALSPAMEQRALAEMKVNSRYRWLGEISRWRAMRQLARCRLLVLSSKMEGGANVVSEAIVASVPVVCSRISGSIGLLGDNYPGYFDTGDTSGLARLLIRAETDGAFYEELRSRCRRLQPRFDPARERAAWQQLLSEFAERDKDTA
jgi:putative glycosyltransferase (TIGR04348 family)